MSLFPEKLRIGDEIRVISPSRSMSIISKDVRKIANDRFEQIGLKLSFSKNVDSVDKFYSSSVENRISDFEDAFSDTNVKAILTSIGGFNSNQLLDQIKWQIIKNNPKIFCGFSDITLLSNAILAKTDLVTYSGPHYSSFGMDKYFDYSLNYFKDCLMSDEPFNVYPSEYWTDDQWFLDQTKRDSIKNDGWQVIHQGEFEGKIIGGNLSTLNMLKGTSFMPDIKGAIMFIEDDEESLSQHFDRSLVSLILHPDFSKVKGLVIGRFQKSSKISSEILADIIESKRELKNLPIIANVDFGHSSPIITFPIGGEAQVIAGNNSSIKIVKH